MLNVSNNVYSINSYSQQEHSVWRDLLAQQCTLVNKYACKEYLIGLSQLNLSQNTIPSVEGVSATLKKLNGWKLHEVKGLITSAKFFQMLEKKTFPVVTTIRSRSEIDFYSGEAPDVFHELFGHGPFLTNSKYVKSLQRFGEISLQCNEQQLLKLAKIFWVTFELGLVKDVCDLKACGAAIVSSKTEIKRAIYDLSVPREDLSYQTKIMTSMHGNILQPVFYVLDSLDHLFDLTENMAWQVIDGRDKFL